MLTHRAGRTIRIAGDKRIDDGLMLAMHFLKMFCIVERNKPNPQRALMKRSEQVGHHRIFGRLGKRTVKVAVQHHQCLDVPLAPCLIGLGQDRPQFLDIALCRTLRREPGAFHLIYHPDFRHLHDFIQIDRPNDDALAGYDIQESLKLELADRLMHRRPSKLQTLAEQALVDVFARSKGTGDDVVLDCLIGLVTERDTPSDLFSSYRNDRT
jgi:hypothetical protein